jgi:FkbM family methyltransferase
VKTIIHLKEQLGSTLHRCRDFWLWDTYQQKSWAQEGEDLILERYFASQREGFYVDVGAHHPLRFSNTYKFYKRGWQGINIDAMPNSMVEFNKLRSRDINIEVPVSADSKILPYYIFNEPALNGFDAELSRERNQAKNNYFIERTEDLQTRRLSEILDEHLRKGQKIDFLSIDVEGFDLEVLKSNDWQKYRPEIVLVELFGESLSAVIDSDINQYLTHRDYELYAKTINTVFYKDNLS